MGPSIKIFDTVEDLSDHFAGQLALQVSQETPVDRHFFMVSGRREHPGSNFQEDRLKIQDRDRMEQG